MIMVSSTHCEHDKKFQMKSDIMHTKNDRRNRNESEDGAKNHIDESRTASQIKNSSDDCNVTQERVPQNTLPNNNTGLGWLHKVLVDN